MRNLLVGSAECEVCPWQERKRAQIWAGEASDSLDFLLVSCGSRKCDSAVHIWKHFNVRGGRRMEGDEETAPTRWTRDARPWWCSSWRTAGIEGFPSDVLILLPSVWLIRGPPAQVHKTFKELVSKIGWKAPLARTWWRAGIFFICIFWMGQTEQEETQRPAGNQLLSASDVVVDLQIWTWWCTCLFCSYYWERVGPPCSPRLSPPISQAIRLTFTPPLFILVFRTALIHKDH